MMAVTGHGRAVAPRRSVEERRHEVVDAAIEEFAASGFQAARTVDIARRAGVSQPYLYALFPDKRALFLACNERAAAAICKTLREAVGKVPADADSGTPLQRLGRATAALNETHPHYRRFHFQARAAATGDPVIRAAMCQTFMTVVDEHISLDVSSSRQEILAHIAWAMLYDIAAALDLPANYRPALA